MALVKIPTSSMMDIDTQMKQTSLVPVKRKRASPITAMDEYKEEMKFYYLGLNYTLEKVRETMESHYNFGASLVQYRDRLNKWGFKKRGTKRQWETIAESVVTRGDGKESEAVINGDFFVSSKKVKKEIARKFSLTELSCMKNKASTTQVISPTSPILATVEVRSPIASPLSWPIFTTWCIPMELLNSLPIKISDPEIITICKSALSYRRGLQPEEKVIMESRGRKYLRSLLYRLSNRLLDFKIINRVLERLKAESGYRTFEGLISLNTISVKAACSSLLLFSAVRLDSRLVQIVYQHYPSLTSAWVGKLNQDFRHLTFEGINTEDDATNIFSDLAVFLRNLARIKHFPTWNADSLRFLRSCFRDASRHMRTADIEHELWSLGSTPMMETEKDYSLLRFLRYDCGISISLLILRALLFRWDGDARMLLRSLISPIERPENKVEDRNTRDPWVVPDWYWAELSPFLDTYLTPKHLCSFLCAVIGVDRTLLFTFLLQYIQKCRTTTEKKDIERFIRDASTHHKITDSVWVFKICAAGASIKMSKTFVEDSLTISRTVRSSEEAQIKNIKAFANLLGSRITCTHIYLQDIIPSLHQKSDKHRTCRCFPSGGIVGSGWFTFRWMLGRLSSYKQLVLPVLVLKYRGNILIPLLSPREENSTFDSLFWLSPKSCCQNSNNTSGIFSFHDFPSFNVMAVGELMFEVISREAHDIRGINGNITLLGSARDIWMVHQNGQISIPPRSHQEPTSNSGSSSRKTAHESSDWETAICSEYRKISMILKDQNKCDDMLAESGIGILTSKTEYEFAGILENDSNFRLSRGVLERVIRRMRDVKSSVSANLLSNEDGVIHNVMRQRRKLLQLTADRYNDTENLECLIDKGVGVNAPSVSYLGTALQTCCRIPTAALPPGVKRIKTIRILVEAGATINPQDLDDTRPQFTPLDGAVLTGDLAVARYLLEKGACIDLETLKYAISYGRLDMVSLLVQFDMKFHAPALELAELYKESVIQEYLEGRSLGRGLFGVPSEFVMFSRIDELEE